MAADSTKVELHKELTAAAAELSSAVDAFGRNDELDNANRQKIVGAAQRILSSARDPNLQWMDDALEMGRLAATHLFQVWGGFGQLPKEGAISFVELAGKLDAETSLVGRVVGLLTSLGILQAVGGDSVAHTARSRVLVPENQLSILYQLMWDNNMVPYLHLEEYFDKYGRKEPQTVNHIPGTFARGCPEKPMFQYLGENPAFFKRFTIGMALIESGSPASGIYDFTWLVEKAKQEPERTVFVDVGGGSGHALLAIHDEFPGLPLERSVLQDRQELIDAVTAGGNPKMDKVQKVAIDFHAGQPTKGAMVYFIRRCLHNYGDKICTNMLRIIAESMADDSRLLIQEDIKPAPPDVKTAYLDFLMLTFGGKARNLSCWEQILKDAGLRISSISRASGPWESLSVLECVKVT
ncbi:O-methyltransferase [Echria macrotheca]|uniref:O-methyltransferase n=1 Tax=Echria macrotheca TaxID=438768 RepID=A0AAJ0B5Q1_9PEZI|nr:O-methyltransferase [Echria macrotheca]